MNCEEYRNEISADPSFDGGREHLAACAGCQAWRDEMQSLDRLIGRALAIDVPEPAVPELPELTEVSGGDNVVPMRPRRSLGVPAWLAVAATVTLAAVLGVQMLGTDSSDATLVADVMEHLTHEPYSLQVTDQAVSDERLAAVVPANIAEMDHSAGLVTYAQSCIINGKAVPHLVIQGQHGPVTILLMPDEKLSEAQPLTSDTINGVILPVGDGSIAIIGEKDEPLERIRDQVKNQVTWST